MFFATLSKASLAILVASLILVLTNQTEAHSYADCIDWKFKSTKSNSWSDKNGECRGYARRFPVTKSKNNFGKLDSDDPNRHYQQSHKNPNTALACSDGKQGEEPGADETMGKPITKAYSGKYGQQTFSHPGGQLCIRWPAKNHAVASEKNNPVTIALSGVNPKKDPTQQEFLKFHKENPINLNYKNCTNRDTDDTDTWPCGGCFNLPSEMETGNYVMQWRWKLNSNEWYTSCADIDVKPKAK